MDNSESSAESLTTTNPLTDLVLVLPMGDRYRRQLSTYRPPDASAPAAKTLDRSAQTEKEQQRERALLAVARRVLAEPQPPTDVVERRQSFRYAYPAKMLLTPCTPGRLPKMAETALVIGKDLSQGGVALLHTRAVRESQVIVSFRKEEGETMSLLIEVVWSRPVRQGFYLIGGQFLERVSLDEIDAWFDRSSTGTTQSESV